MMTLAMNPAQSWTTIGSLFLIAVGLLWILVIAGAEVAKSVKANVSSDTAAPSEPAAGLGDNTQTSVLPVIPEPVLAELDTAELDTASDPRAAYDKPNVRDTAAAAQPVRRQMPRTATQPVKRHHLRLVPPPVSATSSPDPVPTKVYDWSHQGL